MMWMKRFGRAVVPLLLMATPGCSGGEAEKSGNSGSEGGSDAPASPADLAEDAALANEAATDEAADIENFGGNAAAMDGNSR